MPPLPTTTPTPCTSDACEQWPLILISVLFFLLILLFAGTIFYLCHGDTEEFLYEVNRSAYGRRQVDEDDYELSEVESYRRENEEEKY